jgi:hypothetical protein
MSLRFTVLRADEFQNVAYFVDDIVSIDPALGRVRLVLSLVDPQPPCANTRFGLQCATDSVSAKVQSIRVLCTIDIIRFARS